MDTNQHTLFEPGGGYSGSGEWQDSSQDIMAHYMDSRQAPMDRLHKGSTASIHRPGESIPPLHPFPTDHPNSAALTAADLGTSTPATSTPTCTSTSTSAKAPLPHLSTHSSCILQTDTPPLCANSILFSPAGLALAQQRSQDYFTLAGLQVAAKPAQTIQNASITSATTIHPKDCLLRRPSGQVVRIKDAFQAGVPSGLSQQHKVSHSNAINSSVYLSQPAIKPSGLLSSRPVTVTVTGPFSKVMVDDDDDDNAIPQRDLLEIHDIHDENHEISSFQRAMMHEHHHHHHHHHQSVLGSKGDFRPDSAMSLGLSMDGETDGEAEAQPNLGTFTHEGARSALLHHQALHDLRPSSSSSSFFQPSSSSSRRVSMSSTQTTHTTGSSPSEMESLVFSPTGSPVASSFSSASTASLASHFAAKTDFQHKYRQEQQQQQQQIGNEGSPNSNYQMQSLSLPSLQAQQQQTYSQRPRLASLSSHVHPPQLQQPQLHQPAYAMSYPPPSVGSSNGVQARVLPMFAGAHFQRQQQQQGSPIQTAPPSARRASIHLDTALAADYNARHANSNCMPPRSMEFADRHYQQQQQQWFSPPAAASSGGANAAGGIFYHSPSPISAHSELPYPAAAAAAAAASAAAPFAFSPPRTCLPLASAVPAIDTLGRPTSSTSSWYTTSPASVHSNLSLSPGYSATVDLPQIQECQPQSQTLSDMSSSSPTPTKASFVAQHHQQQQRLQETPMHASQKYRRPSLDVSSRNAGTRRLRSYRAFDDEGEEEEGSPEPSTAIAAEDPAPKLSPSTAITSASSNAHSLQQPSILLPSKIKALGTLPSDEAFSSSLDQLDDVPKGTKPHYLWWTLIRAAILGAPERKLMMETLVQLIQQKYPYFGTAKEAKNWKSSIRSVIHTKPCFFKSEDSQGNVWWHVDVDIDPREQRRGMKKRGASGSAGSVEEMGIAVAAAPGKEKLKKTAGTKERDGDEEEESEVDDVEQCAPRKRRRSD